MLTDPNPRIKRIGEVIEPGDYLWAWCSKCWTQTNHLVTGHGNFCVDCEKEKIDDKQNQKPD